MKNVARLLCLAGVLCSSCIGQSRHLVTADIVPSQFGNGRESALCVDGAFVPVQWRPVYEEVRVSHPPDSVRIRPADHSPSVAGVGDRAEVLIQRLRHRSDGGVGPSPIAKVIEIRNVVDGGAADQDCEGDFINHENDDWWAELP